MGIFHTNPLRTGTRTTATIERVTVTASSDGADSSYGGKHETVYVVFQFERDGKLVAEEAKLKIAFGQIPMPGAIVDLGYRGRAIDFDRDTIRTPDPSAPRGWGAGVFDVPDMGNHHARTLLGRDHLRDQRELFRRGPQQTAQVLDNKGGAMMRRGMHKYTLTLQVGDGVPFEAKAWAPLMSVPDRGDLMQVVVDPATGAVALDTDERFEGPPAQSLVSRRPPGAPPRLTPAEQDAKLALEMFAPWLA